MDAQGHAGEKDVLSLLFTTVIKQTRDRLIDYKEEILAEDVAQW